MWVKGNMFPVFGRQLLLRLSSQAQCGSITARQSPFLRSQTFPLQRHLPFRCWQLILILTIIPCPKHRHL